MAFLDIFRKKNNDNQNIRYQIQPQVSNQNNEYFNNQLKSLSDSISNFNKTIREVEGKLSDISEKLQSISDMVNKHENDINNINNSIEKIISLYDIIAKQYNPFIEEENKNNMQSTVEYLEENKEENSDDLPLDTLSNDPSFIAVIMGWLSYLVRKGNMEEAKKALEYYESINWITEDVKIKLEKYLYGLNISNTLNNKLGPQDHLVSLYILTKLKRGLKEGNIYRIKDLYEELVNKGLISPDQK